MASTESAQRRIELYEASDGSSVLEVQTDGDTVWLTRQQMAQLFGRDVKTIGKHIANARKEELEDIPTVPKFATVQFEGARSVTRQVEHYNLEVVLSVGYRVKSTEGVHFRRWATDRLKEHLVRGYTLNRRRLDQLGQVVKILERSTDELVAGAAQIVARYIPGLIMLRDYPGKGC